METQQLGRFQLDIRKYHLTLPDGYHPDHA